MKLSSLVKGLVGGATVAVALPTSPLQERSFVSHTGSDFKSDHGTKLTTSASIGNPDSTSLHTLLTISHITSSTKTQTLHQSHRKTTSSSRSSTSTSIQSLSSSAHTTSLSSHVTSSTSLSSVSSSQRAPLSTSDKSISATLTSTRISNSANLRTHSSTFPILHTISSNSSTSSTKTSHPQNTSNGGFRKPTSSLPGHLTPSAVSKTTSIPSSSHSASSTANSSEATGKPYAGDVSLTSISTLRNASSILAASLTHTLPSTSLLVIQPSGMDSKVPAKNASIKCATGAFVDESCFEELALSDYLFHWWALNKDTCDSKEVEFAQCFFALETRYAPSNCAQINADAACTQPIWEDFKDSHNSVHRFYVAWNLWNTAGFFLDMWTAIGAAEASSQASLASIVNLLDPPKDEHVALNYVLDALTFGMSLYAEGSLILKALLRSFPQTGGLGGKLFAAGTVDGEYQDWSVVAANVGKCTDSFRQSVAQGLPLIQNNITAFIHWSQTSGLSGNRPPLHGLAESMTQALNTYAISRILSTQGIVVARAPDTDVHALQTNGSQLNWDTGCGAGYDDLGVCDTFFWDGKDTYGLIDPDHFTKSFHDDLTSILQASDDAPPLTTGRLLFSGAQSCYEATGKNGGVDPLLDPTDASRIRCLSTVPVCTWDRSGYGPFDGSCKNLPDRNAVLPGFGVSGCHGDVDSTTSIDVPRAYLGPGIYQNGANIAEIQIDRFCDDIDF